MPTLARKITHPSNKWRKPSADLEPNDFDEMPTAAIRKPFKRTAIGRLREHENDPLPHPAAIQVTAQESERTQREQVAQAAAGVDDLELNGA